MRTPTDRSSDLAELALEVTALWNLMEFTRIKVLLMNEILRSHAECDVLTAKLADKVKA